MTFDGAIENVWQSCAIALLRCCKAPDDRGMGVMAESPALSTVRALSRCMPWPGSRSGLIRCPVLVHAVARVGPGPPVAALRAAGWADVRGQCAGVVLSVCGGAGFCRSGRELRAKIFGCECGRRGRASVRGQESRHTHLLSKWWRLPGGPSAGRECGSGVWRGDRGLVAGVGFPPTAASPDIYGSPGRPGPPAALRLHGNGRLPQVPGKRLQS